MHTAYLLRWRLMWPMTARVHPQRMSSHLTMGRRVSFNNSKRERRKHLAVDLDIHSILTWFRPWIIDLTFAAFFSLLSFYLVICSYQIELFRGRERMLSDEVSVIGIEPCRNDAVVGRMNILRRIWMKVTCRLTITTQPTEYCVCACKHSTVNTISFSIFPNRRNGGPLAVGLVGEFATILPRELFLIRSLWNRKIETRYRQRKSESNSNQRQPSPIPSLARLTLLLY